MYLLMIPDTCDISCKRFNGDKYEIMDYEPKGHCSYNTDHKSPRVNNYYKTLS